MSRANRPRQRPRRNRAIRSCLSAGRPNGMARSKTSAAFSRLIEPPAARSALQMRLVPARVRHDLGGQGCPPRRRAHRRAAHRSTSLIDSAVGPSNRRLVNVICLARKAPTRSGSRTDMPHPGTSPHSPWVSPNWADDEATSRSHASASSRGASEAVAADLGDRWLRKPFQPVDGLRLEVPARLLPLSGPD